MVVCYTCGLNQEVISLQDIKRKFNTVVDLGSGPGHFSRLLETDKVQKSIMLDSSGIEFHLLFSKFR